MAVSSPSHWEDFLTRYYQERILRLAGEYPDNRSLLIEFSDIERFSFDMAGELEEKPDVVLAHAREALANTHPPINISLNEVHIRIVKLPKRTLIRDIRSEDISKLIAVEGMIRKSTEVRPNIVTAAFKCQRCEHVNYMQQEDNRYMEPFECENETCGRKGPFKLLVPESTFVDAQKLRVQEFPEGLRGGEQPQTLDVNVEDDLAGLVSAGDRVVVTGILRSYQRVTQQGKTTAFDLVLDGVSIEIEDKEFEDVVISREDEENILLMGQDHVFDKVIKSIAPSIYGYKEVKEAIALQLFSGVPKQLPDGTRIRGDIHVLLVGDPGVAKSQLLRYVVKLAPRGIYTSGKSSTSAGLTATAVKDEFGGGKWTLEAGALVLADKGIVCVDELDKMDSEDRNSLHEGMEQQTISMAKAGIIATLRSRCALLGAANPKFGRFDKYESIPEQINMPPTLVSRFDLIFILTDEPNVRKDTAIAEHIGKAHRAGELAVKRESKINSGVTEEEVAEAMEAIQPEIQPDMLRKYIAYAKRNIHPVLSDDALHTLTDFYIGLRRQGEDPKNPVPVTARQLEALFRLSEASARMRLSETVDTSDAERVIRIVETSIGQVMTDPETGKLDSDIISTGIGKSQRDKIKTLKEIILSLAKENKEGAFVEDVITQAQEAGITNTEGIIKKLKDKGEIIEYRKGYFRVVVL